MKTILVWLLVSVSNGTYNLGSASTLGHFETKEECERVANLIPNNNVSSAGLTKKDLPRGRFRHLTKEEIIYLKHLNKY